MPVQASVRPTQIGYTIGKLESQSYSVHEGEGVSEATHATEAIGQGRTDMQNRMSARGWIKGIMRGSGSASSIGSGFSSGSASGLNSMKHELHVRSKHTDLHHGELTARHERRRGPRLPPPSPLTPRHQAFPVIPAYPPAGETLPDNPTVRPPAYPVNEACRQACLVQHRPCGRPTGNETSCSRLYRHLQVASFFLEGLHTPIAVQPLQSSSGFRITIFDKRSRDDSSKPR